MESSQLSLARSRRRHHGLEDRLAEIHLDSAHVPHLHSGFARVLIAIDGTEHDAAALTIARRVAAPDAKLQLVHVLTWRPSPNSVLDPTSPLDSDQEPSIDTAAQATEMVEAAIHTARTHGLEAWGGVVSAPREGVASAILRAAAAGDAQAIVIVHRAQHGLCTRLHGSVEGELLRTAPCPVLTVPAIRSDGAREPTRS